MVRNNKKGGGGTMAYVSPHCTTTWLCSVKSVLLTTAISPDLFTYSLLRALWNPAFPMLMYVPILMIYD